MLLHVSSTSAHRQEVKIVLHNLCYHHTYRCDDNRGCIIQFCPPDDKHTCSKHVEAWNKLIIKFSASSWLILRNKYIEMHGRQNIKKRWNRSWWATISRKILAVRELEVIPVLQQTETTYGVTSTAAVGTIWGTEAAEGIRGILTQENSSS